VGGVDRVVDVDFGKNLPVTAEVLNPFAAITCYASMSVREPPFPYDKLLRFNVSVRPVFVYTMADAAKAQAQADIVRWTAATKPVFAIAARFPLSEAVAAHLAVERGEKIGHVILVID
jgi:NADPH:quinone reductase-like Zn-dependent oxidoreductase